MTDKQKTLYWMKCIPWLMKYSFRWMLLEHSVSVKREYSHTNTFYDISVGSTPLSPLLMAIDPSCLSFSYFSCP